MRLIQRSLVVVHLYPQPEALTHYINQVKVIHDAAELRDVDHIKAGIIELQVGNFFIGTPSLTQHHPSNGTGNMGKLPSLLTGSSVHLHGARLYVSRKSNWLTLILHILDGEHSFETW